MQITCLGGGHEVGRSAFLLKGKSNILFDYGLKLNPKEMDVVEYEVEPQHIRNIGRPLSVKEHIDGIVVSHAHLDHSGNVPFLYKQGDSPLFLTEPTLKLSNLLWQDTLKIAKITETTPPFSKENAEDAMDAAFFLKLNKSFEITDNAKLTFYDAAHIPGSVISVIEMEGKNIMYTGDIRASPSSLFNGCEKKLPKIDYLLIESTYGSKDHIDREKLEKTFIEHIQETLENKHYVLIPTLAIERSQEIIAILNKYKIKAPIYLDGMAKAATNIFLEYQNEFRDYKEFKKGMDKVQFVKDQKQRQKAINQPCIIVSTGGMLEGGPMLWYIKELGDDPENLIILTSYQVEGTNGRRLLMTGKIHIDKEVYQPKAKILYYAFSAHAGRSELIDFINIVKPKLVMPIHGDPESIFAFTQMIETEGYNVRAPKVGETIELK
ncbi:MAG TPA: MBL fold metallo-hydrolase RNA specificity domain-containing protein [archaeon]|jgi:putative mRNA 3-end processing factor|nr:MBL fold metallo-hydrolase RNA specificity domain-containing protein [archaeon]HRT03696.1 MBL fold metallo-hydrolase RNA specificity domain-containing protein [Candidatus Diapherotrites archaeon]